jgi:hypothetical protein
MTRLTTLSRFAEPLSETGEVATAAARIGVSKAYGKAMLQRLRKRLGVEQCR